MEQTPAVKKVRNNGVDNIRCKDTVFIMNGSRLGRSFTYDVEGKHKIFYHYFCPEAVDGIEIGKNYIFISDNMFSKKNNVFYGNINYGLYPKTKDMRKKVLKILSEE